MTNIENVGEKVHVYCGISKGSLHLQYTCVHYSPLLAMNIIRDSVQQFRHSKNWRATMRKELLTMLGDSCIVLEKANLLTKQTQL